MADQPRFDVFTLEDISKVVAEYWDNTVKWDPWLNGQLDKDMEGLDPKVPEQMEQRRKAMDRHSFAHEMYTGGRTGTRHLESVFKSLVKQRRIDWVDAQPWDGMRPCCIEYVADLDHLDKEYRDGVEALSAGGEAAFSMEVYEQCLAENAILRDQIKKGVYTVADKRQCCPWDDRLADTMLSSYRALQGYFREGGKVEDLTFGPIEVIPEG